MIPPNNPVARNRDIVVQDLTGEVLVYDIKSSKALCLNPTAAYIWRECDGEKSVADISREASRNTGMAISEDIVRLALKQFKEDNLLENAEIFVNEFDGMSRREVIKRVGFVSMIALPVISTLVAPRAVHAQSTLCAGFVVPGLTCVPGNGNDLSDDGCPCTSNPECKGVCPVGPAGTRFCLGGNTGPFCAPGNTQDLSVDCCPCTSNQECIGVCPVSIPGQPGVRFCLT